MQAKFVFASKNNPGSLIKLDGTDEHHATASSGKTREPISDAEFEKRTDMTASDSFTALFLLMFWKQQAVIVFILKPT